MDNLSEEEKKAVEDIKGFLKEYLEKGFFGIIKTERMNNLKIVLNLIEKQSKKIEEKEAEVQRLQELSEKLNTDNTELLGEIENLKNDAYWSGYIDKQNQSVEICKQCKYIKNNKIKDKMIDELVKYMASGKCYYGGEDEIREVFRKKVE